MKRASIEPLHIYGYSEDRRPYGYSAVMVLSTDLYAISRYDRNKIIPALAGSRMQRGSGYTDTTGMLMARLDDDGPDAVRKARALISVEAALAGMQALDGANSEIPDPDDPDDPDRRLARYLMLTSLAYLHGDYYELTAALERQREQEAELKQERERERRASLARHNGIALRLDELGITGYHAGEYESPSRFGGLRFEDMEALLNLAEKGSR